MSAGAPIHARLHYVAFSLRLVQAAWIGAHADMRVKIAETKMMQKQKK